MHITFPLNTSSCLGLGAGRKNNLTDNLTIKNSSLRINKHEPVRFIRLSGLQAYLHDGWKLFFFCFMGGLILKEAELPFLLVIAKNPKHMAAEPYLCLLLFIFVAGCGRFTGRAPGCQHFAEPFSCHQERRGFLGSIWQRMRRQQSGRVSSNVKRRQSCWWEMRCRGVWKEHPPLLGAGRGGEKEMEPWRIRSGEKQQQQKKELARKLGDLWFEKHGWNHGFEFER